MSVDNLKKNAILTPFNLPYRMSPELTLKILFRLKVGYPLNLEHPRTYNEKLQWIKLHDRNPLMVQCCDKYVVRKYVESKGCGKYLNDLLWQGFDPADIPFDELPERYVVKVTHGSTFNIIVDGTKPVDREEVVAKCRKWLKAKFPSYYGEWFYGSERPRVVVERYLENEGKSQLYDYKVFCFNGEPKVVAVYTDRGAACREDVYGIDWRELPYVGTYPKSRKAFTKPSCLDEMLQVSKALSADFNHARIDFFIANGKLVFGEITFTSSAGFARYGTIEMDNTMGDWLSLPCDEVA